MLAMSQPKRRQELQDGQQRPCCPFHSMAHFKGMNHWYSANISATKGGLIPAVTSFCIPHMQKCLIILHQIYRTLPYATCCKFQINVSKKIIKDAFFKIKLDRQFLCTQIQKQIQALSNKNGPLFITTLHIFFFYFTLSA